MTEVPVIATSFGAVGWWDGSTWVVAREVQGEVRFAADYRLLGLGASEVVTATGEVEHCVIEAGGPAIGPNLDFSRFGVALSAPWNMFPASVEELDPNSQVYVDILDEYLAGSEAAGAEPVVERILRSDLDSNGVAEVILVAGTVSGGDLLGEPGDYSLVLFRTAIDDVAVMTELVGSFALENSPYILDPVIETIADLNGDGVAELVVSTQYYEGAGISIYELADDGRSMNPVIIEGCGV